MKKDQLAQLRIDINAALTEVAKKHGLSKLAATSCKYMDTSCTFTLEAIEEGGKSKEAARYELFAASQGLPPLNTEVDFGKGGIYTMVGLNTTGTKVHARQKANGKTYLYDADAVTRVWAKVIAAKAIATAAA